MKRKFLPHVAARVLDTPLMIEPGKLDAILAAIPDRIGLDMDPHESDMEPAPRKPYEVRDGVAVINVFGTLVHRAMGLEALSGMTSYAQLSDELRQAVEDPSVGAILLRVDSHGGEVSGCFDFADEVYAAREVKPVVAIAEDMMCSAAYAIASAADKVYATRTGLVGSIGVVITHYDVSRAEDAAGVTVTHIYAGAHKVNGTPHQPLSEAGLTEFGSMVEHVYEIFAGAVARNRGLSLDEVKATEARVFNGGDAVTAGLADGVSTFRDVLADLSADAGTPKQQAFAFSTPTLTGSIPTYSGASASVEPPLAGMAKEVHMDPKMLADMKAELEKTKDLLAKAEASNLEVAAKAEAEKKAALEALAVANEKAKKAVIERHQMAGRVTPALVPTATKLAETMDADALDAMLSTWEQKTHPAATGAVQPPAADASVSDPFSQLEAKAAEIMTANPTMTKADAFCRACEIHPNLYAAHRQQYLAANTRH